jgi:hypothetical protein
MLGFISGGVGFWGVTRIWLIHLVEFLDFLARILCVIYLVEFLGFGDMLEYCD